MAALCARYHADKGVEVADPSASGAGDACGSGDTRTKIFGPGLRSKVDLSCFSMKADSRMVTAPNPISNRTHFTKSTSLRPLQASSVCNFCTPALVLNVYFNLHCFCICQRIQAVVTLPFSKFVTNLLASGLIICAECLRICQYHWLMKSVYFKRWSTIIVNDLLLELHSQR